MYSGHGNHSVCLQSGGKHCAISGIHLLAISQLISAGKHSEPHRNHQEAVSVSGNFTLSFQSARLTLNVAWTVQLDSYKQEFAEMYSGIAYSLDNYSATHGCTQ